MGTFDKILFKLYKYILFGILSYIIAGTNVVGILIKDRVVYSTTNSPYIITDDIIIEKGGHLILHPGVSMKFDNGVGITVKGILTAKGTANSEIVLTSSAPHRQEARAPRLRLVDGPAPTRGRLQIFYKDKWRSICTNSKNWTRIDREVACEQLGFSGGYFYEWLDRPNNDTSTLLYEAPRCKGSERDITRCRWRSHATGGGVCDMHPDMGLACDEYHALWRGSAHWRGVHFVEAEFTDERIEHGSLFEKVSKSVLEHVRVEYAGMGPKREVVAAVSSRRVPPRMSRVVVTKSAYTGVNYTLPDTFVSVRKCLVTKNGGIGIYVNTSMGSVSISDGTIVSDNWADGVKYNLHRKEPELRNSEQFLDFCSGATNLGQTYPVMVVARQRRHSYQEGRCKRKFFVADEGMVFTLNFIFSQVDQDDSASIEVRDRDQYGPVLTRFSLRNDTVAPSVVSRANSIYVEFAALPGKQVVTYIQVYAHKFKIPDVLFNGSVSERNSGHGLSVDNMRSLVLVHSSNLTDNFHGSGLNVRRGSGDVNVTHSVITNNLGDGVNVTYEGGVQNVTWSLVANNAGRGVAVWFNESGHDTRTHQETAVAYSTFSSNLDVGLLVGNFCREALVNISSNVFMDGVAAAVQVDSCWRTNGSVRNLLVGHNAFRRNKRLAILVSPAVNMNMSIDWNEFHNNERGTIKIYNEDIIELEKLPLQGRIYENTLTYNSGIYVLLLSLNLRSLDQFLLVSRNTVKNNVIQEPYRNVASRSKSSGVVCVGSYNIKVFRNLIENPKSLYELSSHALDQSSPINASFNWLGTKNEESLFERVLDRRDRYTLALIEFHPYLLSDNNMDTPVISPPQYSEPKFFSRDDDSIIGGEVNGNIVLTRSFYKVVRDIYVQHTGVLTIPFGTTLEFSDGIGMMVTGTLRTEGSGDKKVRFTLAGVTEKEKIKMLVEMGHIDEVTQNMTSSNRTDLDEEGFLEGNATDTGPEIPVKLVGGKNEMEGRLMVYVDGVWGTVCNHGFDEDAAAIACQQMGFVLNPYDWFLEIPEIPLDGSDASIVKSHIQCDEFDTDLIKCKSDNYNDLENSCTHREDVGIRCYPKTWAGIRFGMTARESHMKGVVIEKAGLLDYSRREFKPALQVDFNQHVLQELLIQDNSQDGIGIIRNNQFAITNPESRLLKNCVLKNNRRHGITFAQLGSNITDSKIYDNKGSGIHFNPFLSRQQQREVTGWMNLRQEHFTKIPEVGDGARLSLAKDQHKVFVTQNLREQSNVEMTFTVSSSHSNVIGIQILNPINPASSEKIRIFDYPRVHYSEQVFQWDLKDDQSVFPTTSSSYAVTFQYSSGSHALGDVVIVLTAVEKRDIAQDGDLRNFRPKMPMLFVEESILLRNQIGISTLHYDRYLTRENDHLLRNSNETIAVIRSKIMDNSRQAVFALSPFRVSMDNDRIGEITFMFNDSIVSRNGRGIEQLSWDIRESNNLFHWIFHNVTMEGSGGGGVMLSLPYVWQYNENFTHSVYVNESRFVDNADFEFSVDGHFARVNISKTKFERNVCSKGVLSLRGMEKEMFIRDNEIKDNVGLYMVEFNADSQSEISGNVFAYFWYNVIQNNRHPRQVKSDPNAFMTASTALAVRGLQPMNISYNLFGDNEMDYELLAGLFTARINNMLNVQLNWWGSREVAFIKERIFDFEDWNNYAVADFRPFFIEGRFNSPVASGIRTSDKSYIQDDTLGGMLTEDLLLKKRNKPYVVKSDLTVMPGVTMRIEPGTILEFFPSVGILVLGKLEAIGRRDMRIGMRPVDLNSETHYRVGRNIYHPKGIEVRLCIEGDCEGRREGFLDIFNSTTRQWVPMCDERFSERNAQVVCSQLGFNAVNVLYARDKRTEMYPNALVRVRSWPEPIQCQGSERSLDDCPIRMNGQIFEHSYECPWNGDFVYISCGDVSLPADNFEYWGGIRFSVPDFEFSNLHERIHDTETPHAHHHHHTHERIRNPSIMAWVDVVGAGILHNEKTPAILSFYETPNLLDVSVTHSAHDGVTFVSAHESFEVLHSRFEHNLGVGLSLIGLTGETRETTESSFTPVEELRIPYHMFGMIDICDSSKELIVEERVLLYYKYDNRPIDCVKIFASAFDVKKFGFRLLQFNLFNSTTDPMLPDRVILYDGDIYNETTEAITSLNASSEDAATLFRTEGTRLSVQLHATGASGRYGFVAEIVTLPISTIGLDRDLIHNLTYNQFYNNQEGAMFAVTAGEVNPWLAISWTRFEDNGRHLYGNITSTAAAVKMDLQNMRSLYFKNNLVRNNTGGLSIEAGSNGAATKLWANITNNLFTETRHRPSLYIESKEKSAYQQALIAYNDFSWAEAPYHDVITLAQIVSDFSYNYVHSNLGRHILDIYGFKKVRLPVYQTTSHNHFAKNRAVDPAYPGTVVAGSAGQQYVDNVFYNLENAYEMVAVNETMSGLRRRCNVSSECHTINSFQEYQRYLDKYRSDAWKTPIDARGNWWGFNTSVAVSGRIRDKLDDESLLKVNYEKFKLDNHSLLHGCEPGYHFIAGACYLYVGAPITFKEAKAFCKKDNGSLPFLQRGFYELREWLKSQQPEYLWDYDMVWVSHYDYVTGGCAAFVDFKIRSVSCDLNLPFICESDSEVNVDVSAWASDTLVIGAVCATLACFILIGAVLSCWICKSRRRRKERIIRRNSIRASIRSNRSVISSTSGGFSDVGHRRRIIEESNAAYPTKVLTRGGDVDGTLGFNGGTFRANGFAESVNSLSKSNLNYSAMDDDASYFVYETTQTPRHKFVDNGVQSRYNGGVASESVAMSSGLVPGAAVPTFDMAYRNDGFRDTSTLASAEIPFDLHEPPRDLWAGSGNRLHQRAASSSPTSFHDRSIGGSAMNIGDMAPVVIDEQRDIHATETLPRDSAPDSRFSKPLNPVHHQPYQNGLDNMVSGQVQDYPAVDNHLRSRTSSADNLSIGQPLETAM